ncbi:MAG TPA: hypothetical protein VFT55_15510, partial [Planctomycetota bacterium]|nr:hypothetical protein [Planctomycetota bacterium]
MKRRGPLAVALLLAACASTATWHPDLQHALAQSRQSHQDLVVYFALPGREASDRMQARLSDPAVAAALREGGFRAAIAAGSSSAGFYSQWVLGGSEGMGIAVLDAAGQVYAARPGPQDPPELAAFLRQCANTRDELAVLRAMAPGSPHDKYRLGCLLLQLGCRTECEPLLRDAAMAGIVDARHHLARLLALDGNVVAARRWLAGAPRTPAAQVTEGYVLFKERRHAESIAVFEEALQTGQLAEDRQRALLYLGKALHENKQDDRAVPLLQALAAEGTGSTFEAA